MNSYESIIDKHIYTIRYINSESSLISKINGLPKLTNNYYDEINNNCQNEGKKILDDFENLTFDKIDQFRIDRNEYVNCIENAKQKINLV